MPAAGPKQRRLNRLFAADGRTVIVALDAAPTLGPAAGLAQPDGVLRAVTDGGADAVLLTYGLAQRFGALIPSLGLILRCDGAVTNTDDNAAWRRQFGAEDALRLGADAVACNVFPQSSGEGITLEYLAGLVREAAPWHLPVLAESLPGGFPAGPDQRTPEAIAFATRAAAEAGADFVKTAYTGSATSFAAVVERSYLPVVVLGGPPGSPRAVLHAIAEAMRAGASGVAVGRNIWQQARPERMTRAIAALVHQDASVEAALALLDADRP